MTHLDTVRLACQEQEGWFTAAELRAQVHPVIRPSVKVAILRLASAGHLEREAPHPGKTGRIKGRIQRYRVRQAEQA